MKENSVKYEPIHNVKCQWDCTKVILTSEFKLITYCNRCEFKWKNNGLGMMKASETWLTHIVLSVVENYFLTEFYFRNYSLYYYIEVLENIIGLHLGIHSSSRDCLQTYIRIVLAKDNTKLDFILYSHLTSFCLKPCSAIETLNGHWISTKKQPVITPFYEKDWICTASCVFQVVLSLSTFYYLFNLHVHLFLN